jgi:hypothetical protein
MGGSKKPGPNENRSYGPVFPARSPGPLGMNDQADPNVVSFGRDTPGPLAIDDFLGPARYYPRLGNLQAMPTPTGEEFSQSPLSGAVPVGIGSAAVVRIPVPGSNGLFIELSPRGFVPKAGSTSTLFIQETSGKRHLRLDYGYNKASGKVDYHWNQKGTHPEFGISDHATVGEGGKLLYKGAKYIRYGGRVLLVVGIAADLYSIAVAKKRWRQTARVLAGWGGAAAGCKLVGAGGAAAGTLIEPGGGTAVGGFLGCAAGGVGGYLGASWTAGELYDWVEETFYEPLPETAIP